MSGGPENQSGSSWLLNPGKVNRSTLTPNPIATAPATTCPPSLPHQAAKVVDRPDRRHDCRAQEDPAVRSRPAAGMRGPGRRCRAAARSCRAAGRGGRAASASPWFVDDAEDSGKAADSRRQQEDDDEREDKAPDDLGVVLQRLHSYLVPYRRSPASPSPGTM